MSAGRVSISENKDWCTPQKYVEAVRQVFGGDIALDPCSNEFSIVGAQTEYRLPERNGLQEAWDSPTIYVNPPYGADRERRTTIKHWLRRCLDAHCRHGAEVIALIPVATNTTHWKECVWGRAASVCFLYDTRLRFLERGSDTGKGAPMACAMVYWGSHFEGFCSVFLRHGAVVDLRPLRTRPIAAHRVTGELPFVEDRPVPAGS